MKRRINEILCNRSGQSENRRPKQMWVRAWLLLIILCSSVTYAQNSRTIKGVVVDEQDEPIIGASIIVKGRPTEGAITDLYGQFSLNVSGNAQVITVSFIGMTSQDVNISTRNNVKVILKDDNVQLTEVVVVGYGQQKKASVVGAITQTTGKVLERAAGISDIGAALTGNLPGVITTQSTGMPGEETPKIDSRGSSSWNNSDPLWLVDGIERPMSSVDISPVQYLSAQKDD